MRSQSIATICLILVLTFAGNASAALKHKKKPPSRKVIAGKKTVTVSRAPATGPVVSFQGGVGRVAVMNGKVLRNGVDLQFSDILKPGDVIETARNGSVKLLMIDRTVLDLGPETAFKIEEYDLKNLGDRNVGLRMDYGRVRSSVTKKLNKEGRFQLRTKESVLAVRGTEFTVQRARGPAELIVASGLVEVTGQAVGGSVNVGAGTTLTLANGGVKNVLSPGELSASLARDRLLWAAADNVRVNSPDAMTNRFQGDGTIRVVEIPTVAALPATIRLNDLGVTTNSDPQNDLRRMSTADDERTISVTITLPQ